MERHEILDAMEELKLHGMRASFDGGLGRAGSRSSTAALAKNAAKKLVAQLRLPVGVRHLELCHALISTISPV